MFSFQSQVKRSAVSSYKHNKINFPSCIFFIKRLVSHVKSIFIHPTLMKDCRWMEQIDKYTNTHSLTQSINVLQRHPLKSNIFLPFFSSELQLSSYLCTYFLSRFTKKHEKQKRMMFFSPRWTCGNGVYAHPIIPSLFTFFLFLYRS